MKTLTLSCIFLLGMTAFAQDTPTALPAEYQKLSRDIFQQLIEINTTESAGNMTAAAQAMAARLKEAGYPDADIHVFGPNARKGNLVARLKGSGGGKPILLLAHLDVVEARRADWTLDPFKFTERDGYFYGRGTSDIKDGDAILVTNFIRWKREGYVPPRDLILALTSDEETDVDNGVDWLLKNHRDLIDAEYCLNTDGGDFQLKNGKPRLTAIQTSEKMSVHYELQATNKGGHSSLPVKDNAIYHLVDAIGRLEKFEFPVQLNETTRTFFERMAQFEQGQTAADMRHVAAGPDDAAARRLSDASPFWNAQLRTTCVPTRLDAGHANNALPQMAHAVVNCRVLPGHTAQEVAATLRQVFADSQVTLKVPNRESSSPASPLDPKIVGALQKTVDEMWPGAPVVPIMEAGGTDGSELRPAGIPTYGISGVFVDMDDVRAHGRDERIGVRQFYDGVAFYDRFVKNLLAAGVAAK